MVADGWRGAAAHSVQEADGTGVAGELTSCVFVGPAEGGYLIVGRELATSGLAERRPSSIGSPALDAAGPFPVVIVAMLDKQGSAAVVGDDAAHADGAPSAGPLRESSWKRSVGWVLVPARKWCSGCWDTRPRR